MICRDLAPNGPLKDYYDLRSSANYMIFNDNPDIEFKEEIE